MTLGLSASRSTKRPARPPVFLAMIITPSWCAWMVHYDGVHADDLGHRPVAHAILQKLAQHCSGLAVRTKRLEQTGEHWRDESVLKAEYGY